MSNNECENAGGLAPERAQNKMNHLPPLSIYYNNFTNLCRVYRSVSEDAT